MKVENFEQLKELVKKSSIKDLEPILHFNYDEIKDVIRKLNFEERLELLTGHLYYTGTFLRDIGGVFEAEIYIDDLHTEFSQNRPLAYLKLTDGIYNYVEVIDILESVRNDATCLGNPVIIAAINHCEVV